MRVLVAKDNNTLMDIVTVTDVIKYYYKKIKMIIYLQKLWLDMWNIGGIYRENIKCSTLLENINWI